MVLMKVLAIGNSFSSDATRYLHEIAKVDNYKLKVVNLYIGGCSLRTHYINMLNDEEAYQMEFNGYPTGFKVSIRKALQSDEWDFVTMQQVSHLSVDYDTFQPYLNELSQYIKKHTPKAKQILHQTWAYEQGSQRLCEELGYADQKQMFEDIESSYKKAAADLGNIMVIPSGESFQKALDNGISKLHRDTFHASLGIGRYILALTWYGALTGRSVLDNSFADFDEEVSETDLSIAKKSVSEVLGVT